MSKCFQQRWKADICDKYDRSLSAKCETSDNHDKKRLKEWNKMFYKKEHKIFLQIKSKIIHQKFVDDVDRNERNEKEKKMKKAKKMKLCR